MTYGGLDGDDQISSWLALSDASVEPAWFDTGDELTMFPYHGFKLALMICFECEFPESVRAGCRCGIGTDCVCLGAGAQSGRPYSGL